MQKLKIILTLGFLISSVITRAQVILPSMDFIPTQIFDSLHMTFHPSVRSYSEDGVRLINPVFRSSVNTAYPRGYNDGPVWRGKGLTTELHGGVQLKKGILSMTINPVIFFSQNASFPLDSQEYTHLSPYAYQLNSGIDWVQRYGNSPFVNLHPGQSEVKITLGKFITSLSTQNFTLGPSVFNPIIMSNQASGFPHIRVGLSPTTVKFKQINLFKFESYLFYGSLKESSYFDNIQSNNKSFIDGISLAVSPSLLPNMTIAFHRFMYKELNYFQPKDLISPIKILDSGVRGDSINTNDTFDQIASISINWNFPEVGFRSYAEFAKNDFTGNSHQWTILEPEHSRAYTIGFEKYSHITDNINISMIYEHTNLSRNHTYLWRAEPTFYVHNINRRGYTQQGQILGAGIGPGSNSDKLNVLFDLWNYQFGMLAQRIEFNKDYFVTYIKQITGHNVEYTFGLHATVMLENLDLSIDWQLSKDHNRYFDLTVRDIFNNYIAITFKSKLF